MVLAGVLLFSIITWQNAHAHATLVSSDPLDGTVLQQAPSNISLRFNEPVSLTSATLVDPTGRSTPLEQSSSAGDVVTIGLPADMSQGSYAVSWRVVSDDGHPVAATSFFVVGEAGGIAKSTAANAKSDVGAAIWAARLALFTALFFGVGGAAFLLLAGELPPQAKAASQFILLVGLVAAPALIGLQGLDLLGLSANDLLHAKAWLAGFTSSYGSTALYAMSAIACALVALNVSSKKASRLANILGLLLVGFAVCSSGHASVAEPRWLARIALFAHATSIAWWIGALFPLALFLRLDRRFAAKPLIRFSRYIPYAIAPLIVSGVTIAVLQLGKPGPSWWSPYGLIFAAKLIFVAILFAVASWNRWVLTAPAAVGNKRAIKSMRRGIVGEIVLSVMILALVGAWRFTPPPRALAAQAASAVEMMLQDKTLSVAMVIGRARVGTTDFDITIMQADRLPLEAKAVRVTMRPPGPDLAPITRQAETVSQGRWRVSNMSIPVSGTWSLQVEVRVSDFQLVKLNRQVEILPM